MIASSKLSKQSIWNL